MKILSTEQLNFLNKEFGISVSDILSMTSDNWKNIREKCFMIEAEELTDLEDDADESNRCLIATSLADTKYSELDLSEFKDKVA